MTDSAAWNEIVEWTTRTMTAAQPAAQMAVYVLLAGLGAVMVWTLCLAYQKRKRSSRPTGERWTEERGWHYPNEQ